MPQAQKVLGASTIILVPVDAEIDRRRSPLEWMPMRSPPRTCKIKSRPEPVGGGSGRILRRSSQLWPTGMECSGMSSGA
ncbi:hypothetical protein COCNU_scaffold001464G000030 [Cocos nucifera]|nr:hypothetical protein [Cocos nucifera]